MYNQLLRHRFDFSTRASFSHLLSLTLFFSFLIPSIPCSHFQPSSFNIYCESFPPSRSHTLAFFFQPFYREGDCYFVALCLKERERNTSARIWGRSVSESDSKSNLRDLNALRHKQIVNFHCFQNISYLTLVQPNHLDQYIFLSGFSWLEVKFRLITIWVCFKKKKKLCYVISHVFTIILTFLNT